MPPTTTNVASGDGGIHQTDGEMTMSDTTASRLPSAQPVAGRSAAGRRGFLRMTGSATLALGSAALLSGCETWDSMLDNPPPPRRTPEQAQQDGQQARPDLAADAQVLNAMLRTEHEVNAAYQIAIESRRLNRNIVPAVQLFQSHHRDHREGLVATIRAFGAEPVAARPLPEYVQSLNAANLRTQPEVLRMLARVEQSAANSYITQVGAFQDRRLATIASRLAADDVMHWTALAGLMQEQLPGSALSFGT
jgi:hypothetical protein